MRVSDGGDTGAPDEDRSDAELVAAVRAGDQAAYGVLWTRHAGAARTLARQIARPSDVDELVSESFYRVLRAISDGGGPDNAFRPYVLSTLRRANIDLGRGHYQRVNLTGDERDLETAQRAPSADDIALDDVDKIAAWRAWESLPEASRTLLWHLIVEEDTPVQIAPLIGTSPNGVASRAVRARERLRQAFLQQHIQDADNDACTSVRQKLGGYVRDTVSARDRGVVDDHLPGCAGCSTALTEVSDVNQTIRAVIVPGVVGAPAAEHYLKVAHASGHGTRPVPRRLLRLRASHRVAAGVAALLVFGLVGVALTARSGPGHRAHRATAIFDAASTAPARPTPSVPRSPGQSSTRPVGRERPVGRSVQVLPVDSSAPTSRSPRRTAPPSADSPQLPSNSPRTSPPVKDTPRPVSVGSTETKDVQAQLTAFDESHGVLTIGASSAWTIDFVTGPADSHCAVNADGAASCTVSSADGDRHDYVVRVTGPSGASGLLDLSYEASSGQRFDRKVAF